MPKLAMTIVLIVCLILLAFAINMRSAEACTAFFDSDYVSGTNRICLYDHLGSTHAVTIKSYEICKTTVNVRH